MKKERFEWVHSWCDETLNSDLPRVLLVGDSITHNYQEKVREFLRGICYVDYISTSYAIDTKMYNHVVYNFMTDSKYALIHFNHGLHGKHLSKRSYKSKVEKLLNKVNIKIILATSTVVFQEGNKQLDSSWMKRVEERNEAVYEIAKEKGYEVDDLYSVSVGIPTEMRYQDGTHYLSDGYEIFANVVAKSIKNNLK